MKKLVYLGFFLASFCGTGQTWSQGVAQRSGPRAELAVTYTPVHGNLITSSSYWQQGGGVDFFVCATKHWSAGASISGGNAGNLAGSGIGLSSVTTVFGPRYTLGYRHWSTFGQALIGESNGFNSAFPSSLGAMTSASTFALQVGGGVNVNVSPRLAVRVVQAHWLRTNFPNATTNVQNSLQVGTGIVLKF